MSGIVTLKWRIRSIGHTEQRIYRSETPFTIEDLPAIYTTVLPEVSVFKDNNVEKNKDYFYVISSYRSTDGIERFSEIHKVNTSLNFGPGSDQLIGGGADAGFFGEVPASEFITGDDLAAKIRLTAGISQNNNTPWLKFILDGKILFIPKTTLRHSISWDQINAVNAVYGDREIDIQGYRFKIRLLQGINPGESVINTNGYDLPATHQSEWNRLMYPISEELTNASYHKLSQIGPNWVTYTQDELNITTGNGRCNWCQETPSNSSTNRAYRGTTAVSSLYWHTSSISTTSHGWRACLELVAD